MGSDIQTAVAIGVPVLGGLIWLLRLEGRVNTQEAILQSVRDDVAYIRTRIDAALNGYHQ